MKRLSILFAALFAAAVAFAQAPQPLPNDPAVRVGKLDNGMTYYIRHNDQPAQRAEFYLATDVGAYQESDDQDGLAHFLEHMCFNGTKNFPDKMLLEWLQSIGAEFGRNINASTGFEQTQYMLNNIPITRESVIDSCLLILHDYSHFVTCDPAEIDAERAVILEERRTRRNAQWRMFEKSLPYYFGDTPYARRTLIGGEEQLKTFAYESLTNFYKTWCRPDLQAVIVVGDVDVDQIEAKLKTIFADIPAVENPQEKIIYELPQNEEPIIGIITDPEATSSSIEVLWKGAPIPKEMANTDQAFIVDLMKSYIYYIMDERFGDITARPDAPFLGGNLGIGRLCTSCEAVFGTVEFKEGDFANAFAAFMTEVEKMKRFGFTDGEVERAKAKILSHFEKAVEAASTRKNADFVRPLLNAFYFNESYMEPEMELMLAQQVCAMLTAPVLSQVAASMITDENMLVLYNGPEKEGLVNPTEAEIAAILTAVKSAEIEANVEEAINEPLISTELKGSKVKKETTGIYGSTVWTLKNGVKVVVLPTQHKKDQVLFNLEWKGGKTLIATEDMPSFEDNIWGLFMQNSGVSKFPKTTLSKMLAGKMISMGPNIGNTTHSIVGNSTPKDLETALQLMYLYVADPRFDAEEYQTGIQQIKAILPNLANTPDFKFQQFVSEKLYDGNERVVTINDEVLEAANLETIERVYRQLFKDAAGATLTIVGNVDLETLKPMVEKYVGSIPKGKKAAGLNKKNMIQMAKGVSENVLNVEMATPKKTVFQVWSAYMPVTTKDMVTLKAAGYVLDMIYTKTIREKEGGTYGVGSNLSAAREPYSRVTFMVQFDTNPEQAEKLSGLTVQYLEELAQNGPTEEELAMAIENLKKNVPESRISNSYWQSNLELNLEHGIDYDAEFEAALESVTAEDIKTLMQAVLAQGNFIEIVLAPQE
ncbi:MAG: insulinase family protein [Bacteroidales bacterium]|nr:insulinase family protein [Bacteroidales bacterium]